MFVLGAVYRVDGQIGIGQGLGLRGEAGRPPDTLGRKLQRWASLRLPYHRHSRSPLRSAVWNCHQSVRNLLVSQQRTHRACDCLLHTSHRVRLVLVQSSQVSSHRAVKVIFDRIISASRQELGDFRPLVPVLSVSVEQQCFLCCSPLSLVNAWI